MARRRRRVRGEGTVYQRADGQWVSSISVRLPNGKRRRVTRYSKNEQEARVKLREIQAAGETPVVRASLERVADYAGRWLKGLELAVATLDSYSRSLENHILPALGDMVFFKVAPSHVRWWLTEMKEAKKGGRTRQIALTVFRAMCDAAVVDKVIPFNPTIGIPRPQATRKDINPFRPDEVPKIINAAKGDRLFALYLMAFFVAMRQEEMFGLQWSDIDWEAKTARIQRAVVEVSGRVYVKEAKTDKSRRVVPLHDTVIEALRERQAIALKEGQAGQPWVFLSRRGTLIARSNFANRQWKRVLRKAVVDPRGMHHVRHTTATQLLRAGIATHIVSGLLGHSKTSTTTDVYAHFLPEDLAPTAEAVAGTIGYRLATDSSDESRKSG
jgi:integrase